MLSGVERGKKFYNLGARPQASCQQQTDKTGPMPRLIQGFAGSTGNFNGFAKKLSDLKTRVPN